MGRKGGKLTGKNGVEGEKINKELREQRKGGERGRKDTRNGEERKGGTKKRWRGKQWINIYRRKGEMRKEDMN